MDPDHLEQRLSDMSTLWTKLLQAHQGTTGAEVSLAELLLRYSGAAYRYLLAAVREPDVADELSQEFAVRFLRGDFRRADPQRGRFRDYLRTSLIRLVNDYHRARQAWPRQLHSDAPEPAAPAAGSGEANFVASWREELLERTWRALARVNPTYHAVFLFRIENPDVAAPQMAEQLAERLGKTYTSAAMRKTLQRAHEKFAELLLDEVSASLPDATLQALREELQELDLLRYCRALLVRREQERRGNEPARENSDLPQPR
jgi:RNA polymerase sigma-70 factor (ECF subfamily)